MPSISSDDAIHLHDAAREVERIATTLRDQLAGPLRRRGLVVAMSGGVDSSVCAALAVRAVGPRRVLGLLLPERESDPGSESLALDWAEQLGIAHLREDIAPILEAAGCYRRRDDAIRRVVPEFGEDWVCRIVLPPNRLDADSLNVFFLDVQEPSGTVRRVRLPADVYLDVVAATSFKQRVRKMMEYFHADRLHYAVLGTPNRVEYDQGFFVKGGDGLADVKPIAHLYKTQVYQLAAQLGVSERVTARPPTTDTYSLPQSQEEFYFALPVRTMDLVLHAHNAGQSPEAAAGTLGLAPQQVARAFRDLEQKRAATRYLHLPPLLVEPVKEVGDAGAGD